MIRWEQLEYFHQPGQHPAVAAGPKNLGAILFAQREVTTVAKIEPFDGIVEIVRRHPPLAEGEIEVARITRNLTEFGQSRRGHEQRVAPRPAVKMVGVARLIELEKVVFGLRNDEIERGAHRGEHARIRRQLIEVNISLPDRVIVGMVRARTELPVVPLADLAQLVDETRAGGHFCERHHAGIKCGIVPADWRPFRRIGQLPIGRPFHQGGDFARRHFRPERGPRQRHGRDQGKGEPTDHGAREMETCTGWRARAAKAAT